MPKTERDTIDLCNNISRIYPGVRALVEKVGPMPKQGVTSVFSFGMSYKEMRMALIQAHIPFDDVMPKEWQKSYNITKPPKMEPKTWKTERKRRLKQKAQNLFPDIKVTLVNDDAILIAHYLMTRYT